MTWQKEGLQKPPVVLASTSTYFEDEDILQEWIRSCCVAGNAGTFTRSRELWVSWQAFCHRSGEDAGQERELVQKLSSLGMARGRNGKGERGFHGVALINLELADFL